MRHQWLCWGRGGGGQRAVTAYGAWTTVPSPMTGYRSPAKFDSLAPPVVQKDDEGTNPMFRLLVSARCRRLFDFLFSPSWTVDVGAGYVRVCRSTLRFTGTSISGSNTLSLRQGGHRSKEGSTRGVSGPWRPRSPMSPCPRRTTPLLKIYRRLALSPRTQMVDITA